MPTARKIVIAIAIFTASPAYAELWRGVVTEKYQLHSSESIDQAKQIITSKLRMKAAEQVGGYVIRTEQIKNDAYSDFIEIVGASQVELADIKHRIETDVSQNVIVYGEAKAAVDLEVIKERISYVKENKQLRDELHRLSEMYSKAMTSNTAQPAYPLIEEYDRSLSRVFSKGEITQVIRLNEGMNDEAGATVARFMEALARDSDFSAKMLSAQNDGDAISFKFELSFTPAESAFDIIKPYVEVGTSDTGYYTNGENLGPKGRSLHDPLTFPHALSKKMLVMEMELGKQILHIPLTYSTESKWGGKITCTHRRYGHYEKSGRNYCVDRFSGNDKLGTWTVRMLPDWVQGETLNIKTRLKVIDTGEMWSPYVHKHLIPPLRSSSDQLNTY